MVLFTACEDQNTTPETKKVVPSYTKEEILDLTRAGQLGCEILDIKVQNIKTSGSTSVFMELYIDEEVFLKNEYFHNKENILTSSIKKDFTDNGVNIDSNTLSGIYYSQIVIKDKNSEEYRPFYVFWVKADTALKNGG